MKLSEQTEYEINKLWSNLAQNPTAWSQILNLGSCRWILSQIGQRLLLYATQKCSKKIIKGVP